MAVRIKPKKQEQLVEQINHNVNHKRSVRWKCKKGINQKWKQQKKYIYYVKKNWVTYVCFLLALAKFSIPWKLAQWIMRAWKFHCLYQSAEKEDVFLLAPMSVTSNFLQTPRRLNTTLCTVSLEIHRSIFFFVLFCFFTYASFPLTDTITSNI